MILVIVLLTAAVLLWPGRPGPAGLHGRPGPPGQPGRPGGFDHGPSTAQHADPSIDRPPGAPRRWTADLLDRRSELAEVVTVGLEAGLPAEDAWALACTVHATGAEVEAGAGNVRSPANHSAANRSTPANPRSDRTLGPADLLDQALTLSELAGTPAASATKACARALRERAAATRRRDTLLAGPHTSMTVLAVLPLLGPLVVFVVGLPITDVYAVGLARWSVAAGLLFTAAGWLVARAMVRSAARPIPLAPRASGGWLAGGGDP